MNYIDSIVDLCGKEFEAIAKNGKFRSREEIDSVYKLMDIVKDSMEISCMEADMADESYDDGMSQRGGSYGDRSYRYDGGSYARGRGRNARRDSRGRYSGEGGSYGYYPDGRSMRGYSRDGKEEYKEQLMDMMENAPSEDVRQNIKRMLDNMQ
jgi:hypothetical protein